MRWSDMEGRCRRHPEHLQSKGVCPYCLSERLYHLSASSSATTTFASSTSTSSDHSFGSNLSFAALSPPNHDSAAAATKLSVKRGSLRKSESLASTLGITHKEEDKEKQREEDKGKQDEVKRKKKHELKQKDKKKKKAAAATTTTKKKKTKKEAFWSKVLTRKKKMDDDELNSKPLKEKLAAKWVNSCRCMYVPFTSLHQLKDQKEEKDL